MRDRKTSAEWLKESNVDIIDPNGWDISNFYQSWFKEQISKAEFDSRLKNSNVINKL